MDNQSTAVLLRDFYKAFTTANLAAAAARVRDDCVLHVPGIGANAGEYWGRAGFARFMTNILDYNGGVFDMTVPVVSINDGDAFTREVVTLNRKADPERLWTLRFVMHYRWKAGGLSEVWVVPEDQRVYDAYWTLPAAPVRAEGRVTGPLRSADPLAIAGASSPENLALLRRFYDQFFRGDLAALEAAIASDVVVNITGRGDLSGVYRGWDGYMQFRRKLVIMIGSRYKLEIDAIAASERDGWVKEYIRMDRTWDRAVAASYVIMHFEIERGKIVAMDDFPLDTYAWERQFSVPDQLRIAR